MSHCCWQNWLIKRLGYIYMMGAVSNVYWTRVIHFSSDQTSFPCVTVAQMQSAVQAWKGSTSEDSGEGNGTPLQYSCWKIPWTEELGGLQSMGSLTVGHDWATSLSLFTFMYWRRKWQPLQCSCLESPRDGVTQSQPRLKWLSSLAVRIHALQMILRATPHQSSDEVRARTLFSREFWGEKGEEAYQLWPKTKSPGGAVFHPTHTLWKGGLGNHDGLLCSPGREGWAQGGLWWPLEPHPMGCFQPMTECNRDLGKVHPVETRVSWGLISDLPVAIDDAKALSIAAQSSWLPIQHPFLLTFTALDQH